jgi:hypothetical protein
MDFSTVDIEEVGFDRPCTKEIHGSLGTVDIQLVLVRYKAKKGPVHNLESTESQIGPILSC